MSDCKHCNEVAGHCSYHRHLKQGKGLSTFLETLKNSDDD